MSVLIRAAAAYLVLLAAVIAVNFIITPLYHPGGDEPFTVWEVLNWFMAAGIVIALASSYVDKAPCRRRRLGRHEALHRGQRRLLRHGRHLPAVLLELVQPSVPQQSGRRAVLGHHRHADARRAGRHRLPDVQKRPGLMALY